MYVYMQGEKMGTFSGTDKEGYGETVPDNIQGRLLRDPAKMYVYGM